MYSLYNKASVARGFYLSITTSDYFYYCLPPLLLKAHVEAASSLEGKKKKKLLLESFRVPMFNLSVQVTSLDEYPASRSWIYFAGHMSISR